MLRWLALLFSPLPMGQLEADSLVEIERERVVLCEREGFPVCVGGETFLVISTGIKAQNPSCVFPNGQRFREGTGIPVRFDVPKLALKVLHNNTRHNIRMLKSKPYSRPHVHHTTFGCFIGAAAPMLVYVGVWIFGAKLRYCYIECLVTN